MIEFDIYGKYQNIAHVRTDEMLIYDEESALNLITIVKKGVNCHRFIIDKSCVDESFFDLSSKYPARVFQEYITRHIQIAIVGDYSCYDGQPIMILLNDINRGDRIFFTDDMDEAIERLKVEI